MIKLICEKIARVIKGRQKLEKELNVRISVRGKEIEIEGRPEDEYIAEKAMEALDFGFPFSVVMLIKDEDYLFEILNIKNYTKRKDLEKVRGRIIGKSGGTLRTLSELTKCFFEIRDNRVGIIGDVEHIRYAQDAVIFLLQGSKQANVYNFLEKHQPAPVIDLGLKEPKKKEAKKSKG
jgi:ribosomal RNA assembly protein